jgi:hypothetical protein
MIAPWSTLRWETWSTSGGQPWSTSGGRPGQPQVVNPGQPDLDTPGQPQVEDSPEDTVVVHDQPLVNLGGRVAAGVCHVQVTKCDAHMGLSMHSNV